MRAIQRRRAAFREAGQYQICEERREQQDLRQLHTTDIEGSSLR